MSISVNKEQNIFCVSTKNTSYIMGVLNGQYLLHMYYGSKMEDLDCKYLMRFEDDTPHAGWIFRSNRQWVFERASFEYPAYGTGDYRETCLKVRDEGGHRVCELSYDSYRIYKGKPSLHGMPAIFADNAETLEITLKDDLLGLKVLLRYSVLEDSDAIIRSAVAVNEGGQKLYLERMLSACLDLDNNEYELSTLSGAGGRERNIATRKITPGQHVVGSFNGESSHEHNPFMMLTNTYTTQKQGDVYAMNLIYSGNFAAKTELNYQDSVRMTLGIHEEGFEWVLEPGKEFETPEAVLVYSEHGIGTMTRTFHDLYRNHLIRSKYLHKQRPILINSWEAAYFDFDDEKLVSIAKEAKKLGIEMLVMDDGWFGHRDNDKTSLGDWFIYEDKIKCGLKNLVDQVNAEGMKFGIWFEPEMISEQSELYKAHPDWAVQVPGRKITTKRTQYVLDFTRQDILDYIYEQVASILRSANIEYVKWDMNRTLTDIGSARLDAEHMGEFFHRYVLGVYQLQERLIQEFPDLLFENCSAGGGRFDAGMLYYSPQIWASDDMDPVERLLIQEGTSLVYPLSTMGAHVCALPSSCIGRKNISMETRAYVAMMGTFGYEVDVRKLTEEEKEKAIVLNQEYHKYSDINREGDYYRIASYRQNHIYDCWEVVSKDKSEALVTYVQVSYRTDCKSNRIILDGLEPNAKYRLEGTEQVYSSELLMKAGYLIEPLHGDYESKLLHFVKVDATEV